MNLKELSETVEARIFECEHVLLTESAPWDGEMRKQCNCCRRRMMEAMIVTHPHWVSEAEPGKEEWLCLDCLPGQPAIFKWATVEA